MQFVPNEVWNKQVINNYDNTQSDNSEMNLV